MRPVQKVSSHAVWMRETSSKKIQETRNIVHRTMMPRSPSEWAPWDLTQFSQWPSATLPYFPESHSTVWYLLPLKGDFSFWEKPEITECQIWAVGAWVTWVIWCFTKKPCMRCDAWVGTLWWWICQSPAAFSCSLLSHLNSVHGGMFKLKTKYDADLLFYSLSHFECDGHTVHMLTQWCLPQPLSNTMKSSLFTDAHSSPFSLATRLHLCHTNHFC